MVEPTVNKPIQSCLDASPPDVGFRDLDFNNTKDSVYFRPNGNKVELVIEWDNSLNDTETIFVGPAEVPGSCVGYQLRPTQIGRPGLAFFTPTGEEQISLTEVLKSRTPKSEKALEVTVSQIVKQAFDALKHIGTSFSDCSVKVTYQPTYGKAPDAYSYKIEIFDSEGKPIDIHPVLSRKINNEVLSIVPPFALYANNYEITVQVKSGADGAVEVESSMVKTFDSTTRP